MHDSRIIADVGGMTKVTGRRMATPFAPPRPGRTPMMVPRMMPTVAIIRLYGESAIWKPIRRLAKASTVAVPFPFLLEAERLPPPTFGHGDQKPFIEDHIAAQGDTQTDRQHQEPGVFADPAHVKADVQGGCQVQAD